MSLCVVMTTYCPEEGHPRGEYGAESAGWLVRMLRVPDSISKGFIIANDGPAYQHHVETIRRKIDSVNGWHVMVVGGPRGGIGASLNRAMRFVGEYDQWLYTTDDWLLYEPYDLEQAIKLICDVGYDYVRLGPPHPNVRCQTRFQQGVGWWLELDPTAGGFAFGTRPFIASRAFYDAIGPFKEQCDAYVCERDYADRVMLMCRAQLGRVKLAEVVSGSLEGPWQHIGDVSVGEKFP